LTSASIIIHQTTNIMSATKKAKTDDFDILRQYIMNCPDVPKDSPAVQAALKGLEQEVQKRERDAKLHQKFATKTSYTEAADESSNNNNNNTTMNDVKTTAVQYQESRTKDLAEEDDDWHDVSAGSAERFLGEDCDTESSVLGVLLSKAVIISIAEAQIEVETPTAAIALALHAALRSDVLGFACTGIPEDNSTNKAGGFAPPIRELPKTQFLPANWDQHATRQSSTCQVTLRYRKSGTGSVILVVTLEDDGTERKVRIQLIPATTLTQEPPNAEGMVVSLNQHINPDSFAAALKQGKVKPALHYKRLAVLLTAFMNRFDLGQVKESDANMEEAWNVNSSVEQQHQPAYTPVQPANNFYSDPSRVPRQNPFPQFGGDFDQSGPQIDIFDRRFAAGDFAGDFMPGGLIDPNFGGTPSFRPGNLMGPDHPIFQGGDGVGGGGLSGVGPHSGYGMKPRFDPFGPPGGPTEPFDIGDGNKPKTKVPPGGMGEPNHDHMRPPNNLNNNMFG
jgi:hypothetical protein